MQVLEITKELFLRDAAVLQDDAQEPNANLFRGHGDVHPPVRERNVAPLLPDGPKAILVAENLDELFSLDGSEPQDCATASIAFSRRTER